jgi:anti-sigma factor RsiW
MVCDDIVREKRPARRWLGREHRPSEREQVSDLAEAYVLGRLTDQQFERYEEHLFICELCQEEVELLTDLIDTLRLAEEGIDPLPLYATYENPRP